MKYKECIGSRAFDIFNVVFLFMMIIITIYPVWHVIMASFSSSNSLVGHEGLLLAPKEFTIGGYGMVFRNESVWNGYAVSIFVVICGVMVNIMLTAIAAYFLTRKDCMLNKPFAIIIVMSMYFSAGLIPNYLIVQNIGIYNTLLALILPTAISTFYVIILKTAILALPESVFESAFLEGARHSTVLFRIVLPMCMPTVAVLILYYSVGHWNAWFNAMLYLQDRKLFPLQLLLREIAVENQTLEMMDSDSVTDATEALKYSLIVVSTLPILCIYPFLQKYFVKGVLVGAVKG